MKILFADPDSDVCEMFVAGMRYEGHTVKTFHTSEHAFVAALSERYDCYFFAWDLPAGGALPLLRRLRAATSPTALVTTVAWSASVPEPAPVGPDAFDTFVLKPASFKRLSEAVASVPCSTCGHRYDHITHHAECERVPWSIKRIEK